MAITTDSESNTSPKKTVSKNEATSKRVKRNALFPTPDSYETDSGRRTPTRSTSMRKKKSVQVSDSWSPSYSPEQSRKSSPLQFDLELESPPRRGRSRSTMQESRGRKTSNSRKRSRTPYRDTSKERKKERELERSAREREYSLKRMFELEHERKVTDLDESLNDDDDNLQFEMEDL